MDFRFRRGASDEHTRPGSVRSEQQRLNRKDMPPKGLGRLGVLALLLARQSPLRGCSSLAPRQPPKWPADYITYFCNPALDAHWRFRSWVDMPRELQSTRTPARVV